MKIIYCGGKGGGVHLRDNTFCPQGKPVDVKPELANEYLKAHPKLFKKAEKEKSSKKGGKK